MHRESRNCYSEECQRTIEGAFGGKHADTFGVKRKAGMRGGGGQTCQYSWSWMVAQWDTNEPGWRGGTAARVLTDSFHKLYSSLQKLVIINL